jgi:eukaryotic-like serine/threonine-protein kinase
MATDHRAPAPSGPPSLEPLADELILGRYRLLRRLGAGGFGVVWRAHDQQLDRLVAVKRISLEELAGDDTRHGERAEREALAAARLSHPAIVSLYEAHADEEAFYLISELIEGKTMWELIAAGSLSDQQVIEIGLSLIDALSHAHARGVIHRDIKPQNVIIPASESAQPHRQVAKLTDFGGAHLSDEDGLTRTGEVLGTLAYMAPEQSEGHRSDQAGDLYSLSLVLYEAISGVNPVRGASPAATARRIGTRLTSLRHYRPDLPDALTSALDRALNPHPKRRGNLVELEQALAGALTELAHPAAPGNPPARRQTEASAARQPPAARSEQASQPPPSLAGPLALPKGVWLCCAGGFVVWQIIAAHAGNGLLIAAAAAPLLALPRRSGPGWLCALLAPALGLLGLAGAFSALAGQARRWRTRAAIAALAYWWVLISGALLGSKVWLSTPGLDAQSSVTAIHSSVTAASTQVVYPLLSVASVLGTAVWAGAAICLPLFVRGRDALWDLLGAALWAGLLALGEVMLDAGLGANLGSAYPRGLVAATIVGAALTVVIRAIRGPV